jgi:hypothetical protein
MMNLAARRHPRIDLKDQVKKLDRFAVKYVLVTKQSSFILIQILLTTLKKNLPGMILSR